MCEIPVQIPTSLMVIWKTQSFIFIRSMELWLQVRSSTLMVFLTYS